jgi:hypothetical protein
MLAVLAVVETEFDLAIREDVESLLAMAEKEQPGAW